MFILLKSTEIIPAREMKIEQRGVRKQNIPQGIYIYQSKGGLEWGPLEPAVIITALFFQVQITIGEP